MSSGRIRSGISAGDIAAAVLMAIGTVFLLVTLILALNRGRMTFSGTGDAGTVIRIFGTIGLCIFLGGLAFAAFSLRKRKIIRQVVNQGFFVTAKVVSIRQNFSVQVNGSSSYVLECHYQDPSTGILHVFRSCNLFFYPAELLGAEIRVYVDPDRMSRYFVDTEDAVPNVQLH